MFSKLLKTAIGRLRIIAFLEGISFIVLLFIGMPLKKYAGIPEVVKITGWIHGLLFILFTIALLQVMYKHKWSILKGAIAFLSSFIPFGTFILDEKMLKKEAN